MPWGYGPRDTGQDHRNRGGPVLKTGPCWCRGGRGGPAAGAGQGAQPVAPAVHKPAEGCGSDGGVRARVWADRVSPASLRPAPLSLVSVCQ